MTSNCLSSTSPKGDIGAHLDICSKEHSRNETESFLLWSWKEWKCLPSMNLTGNEDRNRFGMLTILSPFIRETGHAKPRGRAKDRLKGAHPLSHGVRGRESTVMWVCDVYKKEVSRAVEISSFVRLPQGSHITMNHPTPNLQRITLSQRICLQKIAKRCFEWIIFLFLFFFC